MSEVKLTPWFPAKVKPARKGVYAVKPTYGKRAGVLMAIGGYAYWSGFRWGVSAGSPHSALEFWRVNGASFEQNKSWRGLAEEPK